MIAVENSSLREVWLARNPRPLALLFVLVATYLLSGCASRPSYTKDEGASAISRIKSASSGPVVYLYPKPRFFGAKFEAQHAKPFYCYLDGKNIGNVNFGEFLVAPVTKGTHNMFCSKDMPSPHMIAALVQGVVKAFDTEGLPFHVGEHDQYVMIQDPATILSKMKLTLESRLPNNFFDEYMLSKECTACLPKESPSAAK